MSKYHKYMRIEHLEDALHYGAHAAKLTEVNDPYEGEGIRYADKYRICCLTNSPKKMLMWAYYVNHRGCCVEFEFDDDLEYHGLLQKADYTDIYIPHRELSKDELRASLFQKGKEWEMENEYRSVLNIDNVDKNWIMHNSEWFLCGKVKAVCFGLFSQFEHNYVRALDVLRKENTTKPKTEQIKVTKCMLSDKQYKLMEDRQYDYLEELRQENH